MTIARSLVPNPGTLTDVSAFFGIDGLDILASGEVVAGGEVYNVMSTLIGDEMFEPTFGSNLPLRVFQPITAELEALLSQDTFVAGKQWLVHASVTMGSIQALSTADQRAAGVAVGYQLAGDPFTGPLWSLDVWF